MSLYLCIVLEKSTPIEVKPIEAENLDYAISLALAACQKHPNCTRFEIWQGGVKIHTGNAHVMTHPAAGILPSDTHPEVAEFFAAWASLPKSGLIPQLSDYLDNAPPRHQPFVGIADVYSPTAWRIRLIGTGLVKLGGRDPTGASLDVLYSQRAKSMMGNLIWEVVSRPVGYLCTRQISTATGEVMECPGICLPLGNSQPTSNAAITYTFIPELPPKWTEQNRVEVITSLRVTHWIDLGAGVPI